MQSVKSKLALGAMVVAFAMPAMAQQLTNVDLSNDNGKVVDAVSGAKWLGRKIGHGTKVTAKFIYNKGIKPVAIGAEDLAQLTAKGTVFVALKVKDGAIVVTDVVVNGSEVVYKDALRPLIVKPVIEAGKIVVVDGAYKMILKPVAVGVNAAAHEDVVSGFKAGGQSVGQGARAAGSDIKTDSTAVYEVVLKPVGKAVGEAAVVTADAVATAGKATGKAVAKATIVTGKAIGTAAEETAEGVAAAAKATGRATKKAAKATVKGLAKVTCSYRDTYRNEPTGCKASAQVEAQ